MSVYYAIVTSLKKKTNNQITWQWGQETRLSLWTPYLEYNEYQISKSRGAQCMSEDNWECDVMNKKWIELD